MKVENELDGNFKAGDKIKLALCPYCGIVQGLHEETKGTVFYCRFCGKTVESLKFLGGLQLIGGLI